MFTLIYIILAFVGGVAVQTFYPSIGGVVLDKAQDLWFWATDKIKTVTKDKSTKE